MLPLDNNPEVEVEGAGQEGVGGTMGSSAALTRDQRRTGEWFTLQTLPRGRVDRSLKLVRETFSLQSQWEKETLAFSCIGIYKHY
jgi:hypothetical protein